MTKSKMRVNLKFVSDPKFVIEAARWTHGGDIAKHNKAENIELLKRLIHMGHMSVFEHAIATYGIHYITRACLQELVRHRIASYSVQSTRFTLKKYIKEITKKQIKDEDVKKFAYCPNDTVLQQTKIILNNMKDTLEQNKNYPNDKLKYLLPENWYVKDILMTINMRSLFNFLFLRSSNKAHFEIRQLAGFMFVRLPEIWQLLYREYEQMELKKYKEVL